ncbi:hypothetical protein [Hymenobacter antarcticus]
MHQLAQHLGGQGTVVALMVEGGAQTMEQLSREIGLVHPLPEVLQQLPIVAPAYLLLDALDAVRGSVADSIYRRLVEEVTALPGWRVVVSVRTFDLRLGREWCRLFEGTPPQLEYADSGFMAVRHVHVGLLNEEEQAAVAAQSPALGTAVSTGNARLVGLARNFFNLALLGNLLRAQPTRSLATVMTRGELLERYWEERIQEFSTLATVSLKRILEQMLAAQSLDIPETAIEPSSTSTVVELQRVGVLVLEHTQRIGFRHHVLFDYAVAKLLLLPDETTALHYLERTSGAGLLISPSLDYWIEVLRKRLPRSRFWLFVAALISNGQLDPLIRIGVTRIAVESVQEHEDMSLLIEVLGRPDTALEQAFGLLAGALLTRLSFNQPVAVGPWADLLAHLPVMRIEQLGSVRALIGSLLDTTPDSTATHSLGIAARRLFDRVSADEGSLGWLAPQAVTYVARTYGTSPAASRECLIQLFEPERFAHFGYIEVPWLAEQVLAIAPHDADFAAQLFCRVFRGGRFSREQVTSLSRSWIIGMSSNAAQDYAMALHSLARAYPALLRQFPRVAIRAFGATLRGVSEPELTHGNRPPGEVLIGTVAHIFADDSSYIWAWEVEGDHHADYATVYQAFVEWVPTIEDHGLLMELPALVLQETGTALAWRALFTVAATKLEVLGQLLWRAAATSTVLSSLDTRQSAVALIAAIYPRLSTIERKLIEVEWLHYDFADFVQPTHVRNQVLGTLFTSIRAENLATTEAIDFLQAAKGTGGYFENANPFEFYSDYPSSDNDSEPASGDSNAPINPILVLSNQVRRASEELKTAISSEQAATLWKAVQSLTLALEAVGETIEAATECEASDALAEGLGLALLHNGMPAPVRPAALAKLLALAQHPIPKPLDEPDEPAVHLPYWSPPAPRITAAKAIASLVSVPGQWPQIRKQFEELLVDAYPAVRLQVIHALPRIGRVDPESMWLLAASFADNELNLSLLQHGSSVLAAWRDQATECLEPIILLLAKRTSSIIRGNDNVAAQVTYLALYKGLEASRTALWEWAANYELEENRLHLVLGNLRQTFLRGFDPADAAAEGIRVRTIEFIWFLIAAVEPSITTWPVVGRPTDSQITALKLFTEISDQLYYAVSFDSTEPGLPSVAAKQQFLVVYAPLIAKLNALGSPRTVHYMLQVISKLTAVAPERCFDLLSAAILRPSGIAHYEHESLGATLFVELIGLYLADYRAIFTDSNRRMRLVDCLSVFVDAGWPEARQLFQRLPEML